MSCDTSLTAAESKRLAIKLRTEDLEQFLTLVRMHLSFTLDAVDHLDLNAEETDDLPEKNKFRPLKWTPFSKKIKGPKTVTEGVPLNDEILSQVHPLIQFLSHEENIKQEGLFRRSGKVTRQQELKCLLAKGAIPNLGDSQFSVHDCATVLKNYLAELPEPLLMESYHPAYCHVAEVYGSEKWPDDRTLRAVQLLLLLLPAENRKLLKELIILLHKTASLQQYNRMSQQNLATLFTPHLLCPRKLSPESLHSNAQILSCLVVFMINEGQSIFDIPVELSTDIKAYWDRKRSTPDNALEVSVREGVGATARTVFSFVDRERTAAENSDDPTETALAQLYAHIQSLPDSSNKQRLIKKFNKENGYGTPRTKSLSASLKKHIFAKSHKEKFRDLDETGVINCDAILNSPIVNKVKQKLRCGDSNQRFEVKNGKYRSNLKFASDVYSPPASVQLQTMFPSDDDGRVLTPPREMDAADQGGDGYSKKSKACDSSVGIKSDSAVWECESITLDINCNDGIGSIVDHPTRSGKPVMGSPASTASLQDALLPSARSRRDCSITGGGKYFLRRGFSDKSIQGVFNEPINDDVVAGGPVIQQPGRRLRGGPVNSQRNCWWPDLRHQRVRRSKRTTRPTVLPICETLPSKPDVAEFLALRNGDVPVTVGGSVGSVGDEIDHSDCKRLPLVKTPPVVQDAIIYRPQFEVFL